MNDTKQKACEYELTIPAVPERVYAAWTDAEALATWFAEHVEVDPRPGGAFRFWGRHTLGTPGPEEATQTWTALEPGARLAFRWTLAGVPTEVELTLAPKEWKEFTMGTEPALRPPRPGCALKVRQTFAGTLPYEKPENLIDDHWRLVFGNLCGYLDDDTPVVLPDYTDETPEVRLSIFVDAPPATVFRTLTEPALLNRWIATDARVDVRQGGSIDFGWSGPDAEGQPLEILELVPDRRLVLSWPDWRGQPDEPDTRVAWDLVPERGGTRIDFAHTGFRRTVDRSDYPQGWIGFFQVLVHVAARIVAGS